MPILPDDLLTFWFEDVGEPGWFGEDRELDSTIRDRFGPSWEAAVEGDLASWEQDPRGALALTILLDQVPRNMFRGTRQAFASDALARKVAEAALAQDWDLAVTERERMFLYFPLGHSENLADQDRAFQLVTERMPQLGRMYLPHVRAHREVIRRLGRFPMRNAILDRSSTDEEQAFLNGGGHERIFGEMQVSSG